MTLTPGTRVGPYEVLVSLGEGGMGEVWKARDTRLGRFVALKRLATAHGVRFVSEARAVASLNHPHICTLHDVGPDYLVMEFVDGRPVQGPLPIPEVYRIGCQIADALMEAHAQGILHCDLKPANILLTAKGTVKLVDFGLARLLDEGSLDVTRTLDRSVSGTPSYMSPEQAQGQPLDERSDVFGFGAVLYELVSGRPPFEGASMAEILSAVLRDEPRPFEAPPMLADLIMRCLHKAPAARFVSMREVRAAFDESRSGTSSVRPTLSQPSIAVLPFANMSAERENDYFSDGLAEEIINALTKIAGLKVTARTSAFAFRGKDVEIGEIGRKLQVRHVLEGSVRKAGTRIRVTAQLIQADDGFHVWSERYDRELTDVFSIQDEIASAIAAQLEVTLGRRPSAAAPTPRIEAYEAYLQALHHWYKLTPAGLARSLELGHRAVALDPGYAQAHVHVGACYFGMAWFGGADPREMMPKARVSILGALALDDRSAEAHAGVGAIKGVFEYDWEGAAAHFRRALALDRNPQVELSYALWHLRPLGRLAEAARYLRELAERDPLAAFPRSELAHVYLLMRRYDEAARAACEALDLEPDYLLALLTLANVHIAQGRPDEAVRLAERVCSVSGRWLVPLTYLGQAYAAAGRLADVSAVRDEMHAFAARSHVNATAFACIYSALGESDTAVEWLDRAIIQREPIVSTLATWPIFDPLRDHSRFPALLRKMNLRALSNPNPPEDI